MIAKGMEDQHLLSTWLVEHAKSCGLCDDELKFARAYPEAALMLSRLCLKSENAAATELGIRSMALDYNDSQYPRRRSF